jgi:selenide,water dikinase
LTKPLGTGVIATALKRERASEPHVARAVEWMLTLNRAAAQLLGRFEAVRACTDVTGYGLLGHASEMAAASGARLELDSEAVPLMPGAMEYSAADMLPGGAERNRDYLEAVDVSGTARVTSAAGIAAERLGLLFDPQTSGGLLFTAPERMAAGVEAAFESERQPIWRIGRVTEGRGVRVT